MQIKTNLRVHLTLVRMAKKKAQKTAGAGRLWRKRNTPHLLVGFQGGIITLEISLTDPQKTGHNTPGGPCNATLGIYPEDSPME